jgi:hypothetical protein
MVGGMRAHLGSVDWAYLHAGDAVLRVCLDPPYSPFESACYVGSRIVLLGFGALRCWTERVPSFRKPYASPVMRRDSHSHCPLLVSDTDDTLTRLGMHEHTKYPFGRDLGTGSELHVLELSLEPDELMVILRRLGIGVFARSVFIGEAARCGRSCDALEEGFLRISCVFSRFAMLDSPDPPSLHRPHLPAFPPEA